MVIMVIIRELYITWLTIRRDILASIIPASLFIMVSYRSSSDIWRWDETVSVVLQGFLYFGLYIWSFCLGNQIVGVDEDRLNKPDRPIPAGFITLNGAWYRFILANLMFPAVAYYLGGSSLVIWAVSWQALSIAYNFGGLDQHWFGKNIIFITFGSIVQTVPAWLLAQPLSVLAWQWILGIAIGCGVTLHLQDFRDVEGDRAIGRVTLPVQIGLKASRWLMALCIGVLLPLFMHWMLFNSIYGRGYDELLVLVELGLMAMNIFVAVRTLALTTPRDDHYTYQTHCLWLCACIGSGIVVFP